MLHASMLANKFRTDAILTAAYLSNVSPTYAIYWKTPHEVWFRVKPSVLYFRVFGCVAFVHQPTQNVHKWDRRVVNGIFVGYCKECKAYIIFMLGFGKIVLSRDVKFVENEV